jgi:uncharacterized membrane protein YhaH (DUF805 family)
VNPFLLQGRLSRRGFWLGSLAVAAGFAIPFVLLERTLGRGATWILYPPFYWAALALGTRRLHDRGKRAWWLLLVLLPVLGPLWLSLELFLVRGTPAPNAYGPMP